MTLIEAVNGLTLCALAAAALLWLAAAIRSPALHRSAARKPSREAMLELNRQTRRIRAGTWCAAAAATLTVVRLWLLH